MISKPPREGARWGDDPAPEPVTQPEPKAPPAEYVALCDQYGETNVEKALSIHSKVKNEYPHLDVLNAGSFSFAADLLDRARVSMKAAAEDGRAHSMPETLDICDKFVGPFLAKNPSPEALSSMEFTYGDEHTGTTGQKVKEDREEKWGWFIIVAAGIVGGLVWIASQSFGYGLLAGIAAGLSVAWIHNQVFGDN
ncbi:MAG: hypothetical protein ABJN26_14045 [Stappiaceae bacterium]